MLWVCPGSSTGIGLELLLGQLVSHGRAISHPFKSDENLPCSFLLPHSSQLSPFSLIFSSSPPPLLLINLGQGTGSVGGSEEGLIGPGVHCHISSFSFWRLCSFLCKPRAMLQTGRFTH